MKQMLYICAALAVCVTLLACLPVHGEGEIYTSVIRLHVRANSDSDADQALKYDVRNRMLTAFGTRLLPAAENAAEAATVLTPMLGEIEAFVNTVLREAGVSYRCTVTLGPLTFPRRVYGSLQFPAGEYESLTVSLGAGEGQNWWCVLYPPLCVAASSKTETHGVVVVDDSGALLRDVGFSPRQVELISEAETPHIKVRFRILELLSAWFSK